MERLFDNRECLISKENLDAIQPQGLKGWVKNKMLNTELTN